MIGFRVVVGSVSSRMQPGVTHGKGPKPCDIQGRMHFSIVEPAEIDDGVEDPGIFGAAAPPGCSVTIDAIARKKRYRRLDEDQSSSHALKRRDQGRDYLWALPRQMQKLTPLPRAGTALVKI
jgi:hypothetical protein